MQNDLIQIRASIVQLPTGSLDPTVFTLGTSASDGDDRIIYDQSTGNLFVDVDGTGSGAQVQIATLNGLPNLTASDFQIV
mgnify:CR=1 FL=1